MGMGSSNSTKGMATYSNSSSSRGHYSHHQPV
jgi:hypothetical protein